MLDDVEDASPVFRNDPYPRQRAHLRKIDSPETETRDQNVDAVANFLVAQRLDGVGDGLRAIRALPAVPDLVMRFLDAHLQRRVRHRKGLELLPVFRTRQPTFPLQPLV